MEIYCLYVVDEQIDPGLVSRQRRPSLSAHEDALRVSTEATTPPSTASSHVSDDKRQSSLNNNSNNNNKVWSDDVYCDCYY